MMKNLKIKTLLLCLFISLQSCQQIIDQAEENKAQENFTSEFMGYYSGSYTGDISGSLTVTVRKDATVEVTRSTAGNPDTYVTSLVMSSFNGVSQSPQVLCSSGICRPKKELGNREILKELGQLPKTNLRQLQ